MDTPRNKALDALAERVLEARADFDTQLRGRGKQFPVAEFDRLWLEIRAYVAQMKGRRHSHDQQQQKTHDAGSARRGHTRTIERRSLTSRPAACSSYSDSDNHPCCSPSSVRNLSTASKRYQLSKKTTLPSLSTIVTPLEVPP